MVPVLLVAEYFRLDNLSRNGAGGLGVGLGLAFVGIFLNFTVPFSIIQIISSVVFLQRKKLGWFLVLILCLIQITIAGWVFSQTSNESISNQEPAILFLLAHGFVVLVILILLIFYHNVFFQKTREKKEAKEASEIEESEHKEDSPKKVLLGFLISLGAIVFLWGLLNSSTTSVRQTKSGTPVNTDITKPPELKNQTFGWGIYQSERFSYLVSYPNDWSFSKSFDELTPGFFIEQVYLNTDQNNKPNIKILVNFQGGWCENSKTENCIKEEVINPNSPSTL